MRRLIAFGDEVKPALLDNPFPNDMGVFVRASPALTRRPRQCEAKEREGKRSSEKRMGDLEPVAFADPGKGVLVFLFAKTMGLDVFVELSKRR